MPQLPQTFNLPIPDQNQNETEYLRLLISRLDKMYEQIASAVNLKNDSFLRKTDPTINDNEYKVGTTWINTETHSIWVMTKKENKVPTWTQL